MSTLGGLIVCITVVIGMAILAIMFVVEGKSGSKQFWSAAGAIILCFGLILLLYSKRPGESIALSSFPNGNYVIHEIVQIDNSVYLLTDSIFKKVILCEIPKEVVEEKIVEKNIAENLIIIRKDGLSKITINLHTPLKKLSNTPTKQ